MIDRDVIYLLYCVTTMFRMQRLWRWTPGTSAEQNDRKQGCLKACVLPENPASYRVVRTKSYLFNKAVITLHGDVLMWLMNTLLILGYVNKRWVGHIEYYMTIKHYQ
ncbi:hypothetical protein FOT79_26470 [Klebsiella pneumoniae]|nr:hypothetical protein [Klebsiella pneumoniae]